MTRASLGRGRLLVAGAAVSVLALAVVLSACFGSHPSLRASIPSGAHNVPLQLNLQIIAESAFIDQAVLQRIDVPSDPIPLERTAKGAESAVTLQPDAQYRISATGQPATTTSLPWETTPSAQISLDQTFSTVETPVLQDADSTFVVNRDKPFELKFSQPIAKASVSGAGASAEISKTDPHIIQVSIANPSPGAELSLKLSDVVGTDGVSADDATIDAKVPAPIKLSGVAGKGVASRVGLPDGTDVTLDWSRPVTWVQYRLDDTTKTWSGEASTSVALPVKAAEDKSASVTVLDAVAADGGWLPEEQSFDIVTAPPLSIAAMWPTNGEAGVVPSSPPVVRFSEEIADRSAAESAITFDPPSPGHFEWLAPNRVQYVADGGFPADSEITMTVDGNPKKIQGVSGGYLDDASKVTYTTGKRKIIDVSLSKQTMTLYEDDDAVWSAPVATGVAAAPTPPGDYQVLYKMPVARFRGVNPDGSHYDIPDVHWVMAFQGDYTIHGAYWRPVFGRPGSDGCVSMTDANAKHVFDWAEEGVPVHIHI